MSELLTGEMRGLVVHDAPQPASDLPFLRVDGTEGSLADYAGRHVVLNFWATWCAPCREEMPSLQNLHDTLGGEDFNGRHAGHRLQPATGDPAVLR
jgi:thiol-disulfide isomerase/thioredoxin